MAELLDIFGRPIEERRLVVCTGPCCDRDGGASANLAVLQERLAFRELRDARVRAASCVRRNCLGKCSSEPLARVLPDDVFYRGLTGETLLLIFERHVLNQEPVVELLLPEDD